MRHVAAPALFLAAFMCCTIVRAEPVWMAGMSVDSSSNMLMRPGGTSGAISSLYGRLGYTADRWAASWNTNAGGVEGYAGIQFHRHSLSFLYDVISRPNLVVETGVTALLSRYGDVTVLDGYNQYGAMLSGRTYLRDTLLFRWQGTLNRRSYRGLDSETFTEGGIWFRFDKFLPTGTTLRAQFDGGYRRYAELEGRPSTALFGVRLRAAQSLNPDWGLWIELYRRDLATSDDADTSALYDRVFLDDDFKSEASGAELHSKYLIGMSGNIEAEVSYTRRDYTPTLASAYWYLPEAGWDENEWGAGITLTYRPRFLPARLTPSLEFYHVDVDASLGILSYDSTGAAFRLDIY